MELGYIYKFYNKYEEIIYIGYTRDIKKRMSQHFGSAGHLSKECYTEVVKVLYAELESINDAKIYEIYYISKIDPKYNTQFKSGGYVNMELPPLEFLEYSIDFRATQTAPIEYHDLLATTESVYENVNQALLVLSTFKPSTDFIMEYSRNTAKNRIEGSAKGIEAVRTEIQKELNRLKKYIGYKQEFIESN